MLTPPEGNGNNRGDKPQGDSPAKPAPNARMVVLVKALARRAAAYDYTLLVKTSAAPATPSSKGHP